MGCMDCMVKAGRRRKIDDSVSYQYCNLCDGVKWYVTLKQAQGRKEFVRCIGCWGMEKMAKILKNIRINLGLLDVLKEPYGEAEVANNSQRKGEENIVVTTAQDHIPLGFSNEEDRLVIDEGTNTYNMCNKKNLREMMQKERKNDQSGEGKYIFRREGGYRIIFSREGGKGIPTGYKSNFDKSIPSCKIL